MKYLILSFCLFAFANMSLCQESDIFICTTQNDDPDPNTDNAPCGVEYFDYFYNILNRVQVHKPVFHFVNYDYNVEGVDNNDVPFSIPALQFICIDDPSDPLYEAENNAFKIAKELIFWANRNSSMLETSEPGGGVLPNNDFKVRYSDIVDCRERRKYSEYSREIEFSYHKY